MEDDNEELSPEREQPEAASGRSSPTPVTPTRETTETPNLEPNDPSASPPPSRCRGSSAECYPTRKSRRLGAPSPRSRFDASRRVGRRERLVVHVRAPGHARGQLPAKLRRADAEERDLTGSACPPRARAPEEGRGQPRGAPSFQPISRSSTAKLVRGWSARTTRRHARRARRACRRWGRRRFASETRSQSQERRMRRPHRRLQGEARTPRGRTRRRRGSSYSFVIGATMNALQALRATARGEALVL